MKKMLKIIISSLAIFCLISCGNGKPKSQIAFEKAMNRIINPTEQRLKELPAENIAILSVMKNASYKVNKVEEKDKKSTINTTIHTVNLAKYVSEYTVTVFPLTFLGLKEEEMKSISTKFFDDLSKRENLEYLDTTLDVEMIQTDGVWKMKEPKKVMKIITVGLNKFKVK